MRTLVVGLLVGALCGWAVQKFVLTDPQNTARQRRSAESEPTPKAKSGSSKKKYDVDALLARIAELEARLAERSPTESLDLFGEVEVPRTDEEIELLMEEVQSSDDLDKLLALFRALLLQGERGYPKLTKLILRLAGKMAVSRYKEEELLQRVIPAMRIAMRHEKELVGYVGYLLTDEGVPGMMRTGAMGAAMFLSVNQVPGSESFAPKLLEAFMAGGKGGPFGGDRSGTLIAAMGLLRQQEAVDPLLAMLNDPEQDKNHYQVVEALGRIGDARAVGPLVARLRTETEKSQWWSPELTALGRIGTDEATAAAEQYLANITDDNRFFNQVGGYLRTQPSTEVVNLVRDRFRRNPGALSWSTVWGLRGAGTPEAVAVLEEVAVNSTQPHIQQQAKRFLEERRKLDAEAEGFER